MATPLEVRTAAIALFMKMKGTVTGNVERKTRRNTPHAPHQSAPLNRARSGGWRSSTIR